MEITRVVGAVRGMRRWMPAAIAACAVAAVGMAPAMVFGDSADADTVDVRSLPLGPVPPPQPAHEPLAARLPGLTTGSGTATPTPMNDADRVTLAGEVDRATRSGIPMTALRAYVRAAETMRTADPSCGIPWYLLAAIGRVESNHGRFAGRQLLTSGLSSQPIIGLPLNGVGPVALISDSDNGLLDTDKVYDRAVGPMQFIPGTWALVAVDGDGDGRKNPHDIDDAALAAAVYLCAGDANLTTESGQRSAVFRYNHSVEYVELVLALAAAYASGQSAVPDVPGRPGGVPDVGMNLPAATVGLAPGMADQTTDPAASSMPTPTSPGSSPVATPTPTSPTSSTPEPTSPSPTTEQPSPTETPTSPATTPPPSETSTPSTTPSTTCTPTPTPTATSTATPTETPTETPCPTPTG